MAAGRLVAARYRCFIAGRGLSADDEFQNRFQLAPGRRNRYHEYHVGFGDRTHSRNQNPHGRRRAAARHLVAVFSGSTDDLCDGWTSRGITRRLFGLCDGSNLGHGG